MGGAAKGGAGMGTSSIQVFTMPCVVFLQLLTVVLLMIQRMDK